MAKSNGSAEVDQVGVAWHDEQLQRVRAVFDSASAKTADSGIRSKVLAQLPGEGVETVAGISVFRDLLRVEYRINRFRRLLRIWSARVAVETRAGNYEAAGLWMQALTVAPVFPEEFSHLVAEARRDLSRDGLVADLVGGLVAAESPASVAPLLASWGDPLVEYLILQITTDEPVVSRRRVVECLSMAGGGDVRHLTARLADPRWYVVRNVVTAIGKTGRASAVPALMGVADHEDERVRIEVIRAIRALEGDEAIPKALASLTDPSPNVRRVAASVLRASQVESVASGIVEALEAGISSADEVTHLVEIIAARPGPQIREALDRLASRKFGSSRVVRDAARKALAGWSE